MKRMARTLAGLLGVACAHGAVAATLPPTTAEGLHWRIASAADFPDGARVAAARKERVLVRDDGKHPWVADEVLLLIDGPYDSVQPAVQRALKPFGTFTVEAENSFLPYLPEGWDRVLLSRRADLRDALVNGFVLPRLQRAVKEGATTPEEMTQRLAVGCRARANSSPARCIAVEERRACTGLLLAKRRSVDPGRSRILSLAPA